MINVKVPSPLLESTDAHTLMIEETSSNSPEKQILSSQMGADVIEPPLDTLEPPSSRATGRASYANASNTSRKRPSSSREDPMIDKRAIKVRKTTRDGGRNGAVAVAQPVKPKSVANLNNEGPRTVSLRPKVIRRNPMLALRSTKPRRQNTPMGIAGAGAKASASDILRQKRGVAAKTLAEQKHVVARPLRSASFARPTERKVTRGLKGVSDVSLPLQSSYPSLRSNVRSEEGQKKKGKLLQHLVCPCCSFHCAF
jgi:hypothetical protein